MKKIGVICAMKVEMLTLAEALDAKKFKKDILTTKLDNDIEVYICLCGIGKVNAAAAAQRLIDLTGVEIIINSGIAGGLNRNLEIGDIVISKTAVYHDFNPLDLLDSYPPYNKIFKADEELIKLSEKACKSAGIVYIVGTVASGDRFVASDSDKKNIIDSFGADCVEMEGAAIAHVCLLNGVRFVAIRSVSDFADDTAEIHNDFEKTTADRAAMITEYICKSI
ncbi:MAG: hypothetical protein A2Y17_11935 [Clostridiales bacterium GWF2_38_85]|nr:MAG: hypothetical protein A2Y17_11935 [Clostridiales bacterium GWF2_38_85]HBL85412.1 5'-methylthioadenosine/adenosylhomocysteine nucleosidase [Clostridiales bacterium]